MLEATDLHARYGRRGPWVLRGVDARLTPGEIVGVRGPSGTGKTGLARVLSGHLRPVSGTVRVDGEPLREQGVSPVQFIFQHPQLAVDPRWRLREIIAEADAVDLDLLQALALPDWLLERHPTS